MIFSFKALPVIFLSFNNTFNEKNKYVFQFNEEEKFLKSNKKNEIS